MINKKLKKHNMVTPNPTYVSPGVLYIGNEAGSATWTHNTAIGHQAATDTTNWGHRVTYIDPIDCNYEVVSEQTETTIDLYHRSGMGRNEIRERIKYDLAQQLASRLIHDDLVNFEENVNDYRRTVVTRMTVKIKRD